MSQYTHHAISQFDKNGLLGLIHCWFCVLCIIHHLHSHPIMFFQDIIFLLLYFLFENTSSVASIKLEMILIYNQSHRGQQLDTDYTESSECLSKQNILVLGCLLADYFALRM